MIRIAARLGAPVTDPQGNAASSSCEKVASGRSVPRTVDMSWWQYGVGTTS